MRSTSMFLNLQPHARATPWTPKPFTATESTSQFSRFEIPTPLVENAIFAPPDDGFSLERK